MLVTATMILNMNSTQVQQIDMIELFVLDAIRFISLWILTFIRTGGTMAYILMEVSCNGCL